jgi:hypothetical protein
MNNEQWTIAASLLLRGTGGLGNLNAETQRTQRDVSTSLDMAPPPKEREVSGGFAAAHLLYHTGASSCRAERSEVETSLCALRASAFKKVRAIATSLVANL